MNDHSTPSRGRETFLAILLTLALGGAVFFFLDLVTLGIFRYVFAAIIGLTAVGFFHYWVWGYGFSQEVAGEREEEENRRRMEADHRPDPYRERRY
jgi:hypothetical protein